MSIEVLALVQATARRSETLAPRARVLALVSGGADSVCLLHVLTQLLEPGRLEVLHVHHGLRPDADADERFCAGLCATLGVPFHVERVRIPGPGNVEARAREARYFAAETVRERERLDLIATGHTASDQVETVLYRLASSPGRRALLGMEPRRERIVRPLLEVTRADTRAYCEAAGLPWREDESNLDTSIARNLLRHEVIPALEQIHPAAAENVLATAAELREEHEVLESAVDAALERCGAGGHPPAVEAARLVAEPAPLRRLVLRRLAEQAAGAPVAIGAARVREIERLAARGGSGSIDVGGGVRAIAEYGLVRFQRQPDQVPAAPAALPVPGRCRFGGWDVVCEPGPQLGEGALGSLDAPVLDAALLAPTLTVRAWHEGDRMRPLGMGGSKSLQDVFSDRKVPRSLRRSLPVVLSGEDIAWVAGVAVSEEFKLTERTAATVRLTARAVGPAD
jgi:tRNA(Ile)-lysidine synthase